MKNDAMDFVECMFGYWSNERQKAKEIKTEELNKAIQALVGLLPQESIHTSWKISDPYRLKNIIKLRFGLVWGQKKKTLEEVAVVFNVTRERIRQLEASAFRKLRHRSRLDGFKNFINGR